MANDPEAVEAVARAIFDSHNTTYSSPAKWESDPEHWRRYATAALTAAKPFFAQARVDEWLPIETAPEDETVDVWIDGPAPRRMSWCRKDVRGHWYHSECGCRGWVRLDTWASVTHWRPLPDAPRSLSPAQGEGEKP